MNVADCFLLVQYLLKAFRNRDKSTPMVASLASGATCACLNGEPGPHAFHEEQISLSCKINEYLSLTSVQSGRLLQEYALAGIECGFCDFEMLRIWDGDIDDVNFRVRKHFIVRAGSLWLGSVMALLLSPASERSGFIDEFLSFRLIT